MNKQTARQTTNNTKSSILRRIASRLTCQTAKRANRPTRRFTYVDCLRDIAPAPTGINGTTLYSLLMVGGSVTVMVTANGFRSSGAEFLEESH